MKNCIGSKNLIALKTIQDFMSAPGTGWKNYQILENYAEQLINESEKKIELVIGTDIENLSDELQLSGEETMKDVAQLMKEKLEENRIPGVKLRRWFNLCISLPKLTRVWTTMLILCKYSNYKNVGSDLLKSNIRVDKFLKKFRKKREAENGAGVPVQDIFNPLK